MIDVNSLITQTSNINGGILSKDRLDRFIVTDLDIDDLIPSEDNFYSLSDLDSLKNNIEEFGLQQNLTVMRRDDKKYEIISGHRRHAACRLLVKEGKTKFSRIPCRIMAAMNDTLKNILLITMNSETRKETPAEVTESIERLKILYENYKKENPDFKGRVREAIAKGMNMSTAAVGMHEKISNNLDEELKEKYKSGDLAFTAAAELASLSPADQKAVYEKTGGKVKVAEVRKSKKKASANQSARTNKSQNKNSGEIDEFGRRNWGDFQTYAEYDEIIDIKDSRLPEGGYRLYIVQDKEDKLWRATSARGFVEVGAGRWPHRSKEQPKDNSICPAFDTRNEAFQYVVDNMLISLCSEKEIAVLNELGYEHSKEREIPLEELVIEAKSFAKKLTELQQEYKWLRDKIPAVERAMGPLEETIRNLHQDIAAIEAGVLGEPLFEK